MATIGNGLLTFKELLGRLGPDGMHAKVVESMSKTSALLPDMVWREGNLPTGHVFTSRNGLPTLGWRSFNEGVAPSKSSTGQITETCGQLEGNSIVDCRLAELNGNEAAFRAGEDMAFVQAFNHELETAFFYESTKTNPNRLMGLSPRLDSISGNPYANQVLDSHTTSSGSDQTSIWIIAHGPVYGIYPKGTMFGLKPTDLSRQLVADSGGVNQFMAYVTNWNWQPGLCVEDARYVVRIANIDTSALAATGDGLITDLIVALEERMQDLKTGTPVIYCNRKIATYLHLQARDAVKNSTLTYENVGGQPVLMFMGVPVKRTDALLNTEAVIS